MDFHDWHCTLLALKCMSMLVEVMVRGVRWSSHCWISLERDCLPCICPRMYIPRMVSSLGSVSNVLMHSTFPVPAWLNNAQCVPCRAGASGGFFILFDLLSWPKLVAQRLKRLPPMRETWVRSLGQEDPLEKEMVIHSSILAWRIPWTEKPGRTCQSWTRLSDFTH